MNEKIKFRPKHKNVQPFKKNLKISTILFVF